MSFSQKYRIMLGRLFIYVSWCPGFRFMLWPRFFFLTRRLFLHSCYFPLLSHHTLCSLDDLKNVTHTSTNNLDARICETNMGCNRKYASSAFGERERDARRAVLKYIAGRRTLSWPDWVLNSVCALCFRGVAYIFNVLFGKRHCR